MKKYQSFLSENFQFLEVKFSIYLNRRVFIMIKQLFVLFYVYQLCLGCFWLLHTECI